MSTLFKTVLDDDGDAGWAGGVGVGVSEDAWPRFDGQPMQHLVTLKREAIWADLPPEVAAVAVFQSELAENDALAPGTEESAVIFLDAAALSRPSWPEAPVGAPATKLRTERVDYDFAEVAELEDERGEDELDAYEISSAISGFILENDAFLYSAPHVAWLQAPETPEGHALLFWIDDDVLEGTNFGTGCLYVSGALDGSEGTAWFQC